MKPAASKKSSWPEASYSRWASFEQSLRAKMSSGNIKLRRLNPATGLQDAPLARPTQPISKAHFAYSPMDDLSLSQISGFLHECGCATRGTVEPQRPAGRPRKEPAKHPKPSLATAPSQLAAARDPSSGYSGSTTPSAPTAVAKDKSLPIASAKAKHSPSTAPQPRQTPAPAKSKPSNTAATAAPATRPRKIASPHAPVQHTQPMQTQPLQTQPLQTLVPAGNHTQSTESAKKAHSKPQPAEAASKTQAATPAAAAIAPATTTTTAQQPVQAQQPPTHQQPPPPPSAVAATAEGVAPEGASMNRLLESSYQLTLAMLISYVLSKSDNPFPEELGASLNQVMDKVTELERRLAPNSDT